METQSSNGKVKVLAVDDEEFNIDLLEDYLSTGGFDVVTARDGIEALAALEANPDVQIAVIDRMMPNMDGMRLLAEIKNSPKTRHLPVVMQTAAARSDQMLEGIRAGVYYYLTKPYDEELLLSIVWAALRETQEKNHMQQVVRKQSKVVGLMESAAFRFRTLEDAKNLAYYIANCCPDPESSIYGLNELMINAVEHGNLGITYNEKTQLVMAGTWQGEVDKRLELPENQTKFGKVIYENKGNEIVITIKDEGKGFDWKNYVEIDWSRMTDPHGRGIATSKMMSFTNMEYRGIGNEVVCTIAVGGKEAIPA